MKRWQRYWLYTVIVFFTYHLLRDILQTLQINTFISDIFVKEDRTRTPWWYWVVFNTYVIELTQLFFAFLCLRTNRFGFLGEATIVISVWFLTVWLFYWVIL